MFRIKVFRRNRVGCVKLVAVIACCCLIYFLVKLIFIPDVSGNEDISSIYYTGNDVLEESIGESNDINEHIKLEEEAQIKSPILKGNEILRATKQSDAAKHGLLKLTSEMAEPKNDVEVLMKTVKKLNIKQYILNKDKFPKRSADSIVIVVQVHNRVEYLRKLVKSLKNTRGMSDALLIFSHDYISNEINSLVRSITFCQVLQLYFPYSQQLHPDKFPGTDPNDCPRDQKVEGCNNADHPDSYGHYREAKFTMTKHHWWWKANRVFSNLYQTKDHKGLVLFLEEDHYVAPDFYELLQKAYYKKKTTKACNGQECDILTLGDYHKLYTYEGDNTNVLESQQWQSSKHNMGMAFDRKTWEKIAKCDELFCIYDDYNWDWTLMKISVSCLSKPFTVLLVKLPRIFHLGTCGLHHKNGDCDVERVVNEVDNLISNGAKVLHPEKVVIQVGQVQVAVMTSRPNGGWGDIRDHELCLKFSKSTD